MTEQVVATGMVVGIYYTLKDSRGTVLDTNRKGGKPMPYLHGSGNILPGLERALEGKHKNDFVSVDLAPADGYGEKRADLVRALPRKSFPAELKLAPGQRLTGRDPDGRSRTILVMEVGEDEVKVDENHPLAGEALHFEVTIVGIREATEEERTHGHAHGPGGHHGH